MIDAADTLTLLLVLNVALVVLGLGGGAAWCLFECCWECWDAWRARQ